MTARSNLPVLTVLTAASLLASATAQRELRAFTGIQADAKTGQAVAPAGDVDGDGVDDLIVGHPLNDYPNIPDRGTVIVYSGANGSWIANSIGSRPGMQLGSSVCRLGDVDGDGVTDIGAGAPADDGGGSNAGYVRVFSGRTGGLIWDRTGDSGSRFGTSICAVGDLDLDGRPDLAVGAPHNSSSRPYGAVYIHSGRTGARITELIGGSQEDFGHSIACPGDLDGDGRVDLLVGSPGFDFLSTNSGNVFAFGTRGTSRPQRLWMFYDSFIGMESGGVAVAGLGDVDGDGRPDALVGGMRGRAFAVSGRTGAMIRQHSGPSADHFAGSVAGLGDVDGDGTPDYAIGAANARSGAGAVVMFRGRDGGTIGTIHGTPGSNFGVSIAGIADIDGDGLGEIGVGAPNHVHTNGRRTGRATLHGVDIQGGATAFGAGCPANRPLTLAASGDLRFGGTLRLDVSNGNPFNLVVMFLGRSRTTWNHAPLPVALGAIGHPGCEILVSVDAILSSGPTSLTGAANASLRLPADPALIGTTAHAQALHGLPGLPLSTSNGLTIRIGNR